LAALPLSGDARFHAGRDASRLLLKRRNLMHPMRISAAAAAFLVAACATAPVEPLRATAQLQPTKGSKVIGEATFEEVDGKVHVVVYVQGLKPGQEHGLHIHEVGDCSSGDGMSTKGHFNPFGKPHAHAGTSERHAGDLPSLKAEKNGRAKVDVKLDVITVAPGAASVVGRGLIVHADPDDYRTQPTGNAGARIACGVIQPG
jgi:Cu-Zn family superoxide dismutase